MDDVLVVGEALIDIVHPVNGEVSEHPGGSPANVALGLGRLGRRVALLTRFGDDARGQQIRRRLEESGVDIVPSSQTADPTSTATAELDAAGVATYHFEIDWRLPDGVSSLQALGDGAVPARALHTGSIAAFLPPGGDDVLRLVTSAKGQATITYDPNARPRLMGDAASARQRIETFVRAADVVKVSDEDLAFLVPDTEPVDVAEQWLHEGPAIVVLTRGGAGAIGFCRAGRVDVAAPPIRVVDTVGAGDSFMSGLLDSLAEADLLGADRLEALRAIGVRELSDMVSHAVGVSAITCQRPGADPPRREDLPA